MEIRTEKIYSALECQLGLLAGFASGDSERVDRWEERYQMDTIAEDAGDPSLWPLIDRWKDQGR